MATVSVGVGEPRMALATAIAAATPSRVLVPVAVAGPSTRAQTRSWSPVLVMGNGEVMIKSLIVEKSTAVGGKGTLNIVPRGTKPIVTIMAYIWSAV